MTKITSKKNAEHTRVVISAFVLALVSLGGIVALYLMATNQDFRQQAWTEPTNRVVRTSVPKPTTPPKSNIR